MILKQIKFIDCKISLIFAYIFVYVLMNLAKLKIEGRRTIKNQQRIQEQLVTAAQLWNHCNLSLTLVALICLETREAHKAKENRIESANPTLIVVKRKSAWSNSAAQNIKTGFGKLQVFAYFALKVPFYFQSKF